MSNWELEDILNPGLFRKWGESNISTTGDNVPYFLIATAIVAIFRHSCDKLYHECIFIEEARDCKKLKANYLTLLLYSGNLVYYN